MSLLLTVISGVSIFVVGQWVLKAVIDPVHEQDKVIGEIAFRLTSYANVYTNPCATPEDKTTVRNAIRESAAHLEATTFAIRLYCLLVSLHLVRTNREEMGEAIELLIRMSNSVANQTLLGQNTKDAQNVRHLLHIRDKRQSVRSSPQSGAPAIE